MILGDNDERTADPKLIKVTLDNLQSGKYGVNHNSPFKGGHITRYFGNPKHNIHALQLEMNKILYMDDEENAFSEPRANEVRSVLIKTFNSIIQELETI